MPTWSYGFNPNGNTVDAVRFIVGQSSTQDDLLLFDEEINWTLAQRGGNIYGAASLCCESLASKYAARPESEKIGSLGLTWGDVAERLRRQAKELRWQLTLAGVSPYAGGISRSDMRTDTSDTDRNPLQFKIRQDDNYRTGTRSTST